MEERRPASYSVEVYADRANVKEVVTGVLHTIFWYRIFANLQPVSHDVLEVSLPWVQDVNLQTLIEQRVDNLVRQIDADPNHQSPEGRVMVVHFSERERKRKKGWFGGKGDDDLIWETWTLNVTVVLPRTPQEASKTRRSVERSLINAAMRITDLALLHKDDVPPITTQDTNTFPYQILVINPRQEMTNTRQDGWGQRISLF